MRKNIKKKLGIILKPLLKKYGYELKKIAAAKPGITSISLSDNFFSLLRKHNYTPSHLLDVGANHGSWTRKALKYFPDAHYSMVEPQHWLKTFFIDLLEKNQKIRFFPVGTGKENGIFKFTLVERDDSCTFRLTEEEALGKDLKQIDLPVITLDDLIVKNNLSIPDIVKIDAEGLDLEVLEGASLLLGKTEIILVEAGIMNKNFYNSALRVLNYMEEKGYRLFDITDMNRPFTSGVLWLVELVFVKKEGFLDKKNFRENL